MNPPLPDIEVVLEWINTKLFATTGEHLTELQRVILQQVWKGRKYSDIADLYGCTDGHAKDVGSALWKQLTLTLGERVSKQNVRSLLIRKIKAIPRKSAKVMGAMLASYPNTSVLASGQLSPEVSAQTSSQNPAQTPFHNYFQAFPLQISSALSAFQASPDSSSESPSFVGRAGAIAHLNTLVIQGTRMILIQGEGGLGKTTLAQNYLGSHSFEAILELVMAKESSNITPVERVVEEWFSKDLGEEPGQEFGITLGRLKRHLEQRCLGILIDNLEPALDRDGRLIKPHRSYVELLRVLADHRGQSVTLLTSRDRLCEPSVTVEHFRLPRLDYRAWSRFFQHRSVDLTSALTSDILQTIHHTYGGNAKAMGLLYGSVREDFEGDLDAYWQENSGDPLAVMDLKNLVANQFNRIQTLDVDAYRLLCRLGCYRYQSVATIPTAGLQQLLWDVEPHRQKRVIASLRNRSLIESAKGQYWLHPVIRAEAIARLQQMSAAPTDSTDPTEEWTLAHQQAALFWTRSVGRIQTLADALQAWEAHYHYLAIEDFEAASQVILHSRDNQWGQFLPLGSTLYRMGLLKPVLSAIEYILPHVQADRNVSELHNIFGDLLWITGQVHRAIASQKKAIAIARSATKALHCPIEPSNTTQLDTSLGREHPHAHQCYTFRMIEIDSLLSIGLYHIDLWDLPQAIHQFKSVIDLADQTPHHAWAKKAKVCLALALSYQYQDKAQQNLQKLELATLAKSFADPIYRDLLDAFELEDTARFAYFIQLLGQTYANLGDRAKAQVLYQRAIQFSETSHYTQVRARTLNGLAELHRMDQHWDKAIAKHQEAIALLEKIGAKCDLAESHYQLGLTLQQQGFARCNEESLQSQHLQAFQAAIQLFTTMNSPQQVAKVKLRQKMCD
ncbi:MAG: tetratricopeptide repeat protein [Cyanobacteria bacterium P01_F01_bin.150]